MWQPRASECWGAGSGCGRPPERQGNKRYRRGAEMVIQREPREHWPENGGHTPGQKRGEKRELTDGRSWRRGVRETVSPPPETDGRTERHARGKSLRGQARPGARDGGRDGGRHGQARRLQRRRGRKKSGGGSGGTRRARGGRSGAGAGAGSRLVKAAPSGEIAARIAELHKTPPARLAAAPAPISSLIAARAGYAFKCYLIGLRRSWGPERPPPPPRTRRAPGRLPPPQICFPSHRLPRTPSLPAPPPR